MTRDAARGHGCRLCGATPTTKHHLLKRRARRLLGRGAKIELCRPCHDLLHKGPAESRRRVYDDLRAVLTEREVALLDADPFREWWEAE